VIQEPFSPWWRRVVAAVVDSAVIAVPALLILELVGQAPIWDRHGDVLVRWLIALAVTAAYYVPLMVATNGSTLGKLLLGIRVRRTDQEPMSVERAAWREVVLKQVILNLPSTFGGGLGFAIFVASLLDVLWPLWDREKRALHDMLARTRVRQARTEEPARVAAA
jgi:uncharacterized RDD family membrane protein YckC